jgi:hypothetical protein
VVGTPDDLVRAIRRRQVVKATLMRALERVFETAFQVDL